MKQRRAALEDASHQAGWMFADLLLALMVIFLAAQSFVPHEASLPQFAGLLGDSVNVKGNIKVLKTSITLVSLDEATLINALQNYGAIQHLPADYTIDSMVVAGGFNAATESSDRGTATALQYAAGIASYNLPYFKNSATLLAASSQVPDGAVVLNISITPVAGKPVVGATPPAPTPSN